MSSITPITWHEVTLGDVLQLRRERARGSEELLSVTRDRGVVRQIDAGRRDISSEDKSSYWRVHAGDIVYNTMRMWQGVVGRSEFNGIVSPAYTVCRPTDLIDTQFLAYKLKHPTMIANFYRLSQGLVSDTWNLKYSALSTIRTSIPSLSHQKEIARIFGRVDRLILDTGKVIQKVLARRAAMSAVLLEGRNVNVTMADILVTNPKNGIYKPASEYNEIGTPIVRIDSIQDGEINSCDSLLRVSLGAPEKAMFGLQEGDILINRVNSIDLVGKSALVRAIPESAVFESNIMRCRIRGDLARPAYIALWLATSVATTHFRSSAKSAIAQASINQRDVIGCPVALPSLPDQDELVAYFDQERCEINTRKNELSKLYQLKLSLMEELVAGSK